MTIFREIKPTENTHMEHEQIMDFIKNSPDSRPNSYKMNDLKWRFAVRTVLRGKNMMCTGPKGCGKTMLAFELSKILERPLFNIPMGSTQDPQSVLIGNTHFNKDKGTYTVKSRFIEGIQTPNAIILLDELTRAHPDAWNILMPALDYKQRFVRIDNDPETPTIEVAPGVTFIATANIGAQYTATRTLDAALTDRFIVVEIEPLGLEMEMELLQQNFPALDSNIISVISKIAVDTRLDAMSNDPRLSDIVSTRATLELASLVYDGFSLEESIKLVVYPMFSDAGGVANSERSFVKQIVQKHLPTSSDDKESPFQPDNDDDDLPWMTKP